eukprot:13987060-Ditylum_brightwellii.AAC.1
MTPICVCALPSYRPEWDFEIKEIWIYFLLKMTMSVMQLLAEEDYWLDHRQEYHILAAAKAKNKLWK